MTPLNKNLEDRPDALVMKVSCDFLETLTEMLVKCHIRCLQTYLNLHTIHAVGKLIRTFTWTMLNLSQPTHMVHGLYIFT